MEFYDNNINSSKGSSKEILEELKAQLKEMQISECALEKILVAIFLSYVNTIKSKVEVLDKINGTNYSKDLPGNDEFDKLSNILIFLGSNDFFRIAEEKLKINKEKFEKDHNLNIEKEYSDSKKEYVSSLLLFMAAIIDCC